MLIAVLAGRHPMPAPEGPGKTGGVGVTQPSCMAISSSFMSVDCSSCCASCLRASSTMVLKLVFSPSSLRQAAGRHVQVPGHVLERGDQTQFAEQALTDLAGHAADLAPFQRIGSICWVFSPWVREPRSCQMAAGEESPVGAQRRSMPPSLPVANDSKWIASSA
jgi:hypothetical protein